MPTATVVAAVTCSTDALPVASLALLAVVAGCAGPVAPAGPADGGGESPSAAATPPPTASSAVPTTTPHANATATPTIDPAKVIDHEDVFSDASRELVADAVAAGGTLAREGDPAAASDTFYEWPYVNYRGACYEISTYSTVVFVKRHVRFSLRLVDADAVENESAVAAYEDLPAVDRRAVEAGLPPSHGAGRVGESTSVLVRRSIRYGVNDTVRHVETPSVVTDYRYVEYRGEYYEVTHVTRLHGDVSEVLSTTVVADRVRDEPCPTGD